jgi:sugar O-acyltransferase (sialic acid O-acetyltransferase NeuD family)
LIKVVGFGAGGHARVMLEILAAGREIEVVGLLTAKTGDAGQTVAGVRVLGDDHLLAGLIDEGVTAAFIAVGSIGDSTRRRALYELALQHKLALLPVIHPSAIVSPSARVGAGPTIMAGVIVNAAADIGANVILNSGAIVEHDVRIGDHSHIAPGARIGAGVSIGAGSHIGIGAAVRQGQRIGAGAIVGAGAVVVHDVPDGATVAGVPARPLERTP